MSPVIAPGAVATRRSWDEWALGVAAAVATRGDCTRRQVGAVILDPGHRIVATGYNGAPPGRPGCLSDGACPRGRFTHDQLASGTPYVGVQHTCTALHAEENAVIHADRASLLGATVYITDEPCENCRRFLTGAGLARAVWPGGSIDFLGRDTP